MKDKKRVKSCMTATSPETSQNLLVGVSKTNILCFLPAPKSVNLMVGLDLGQGNKIWKEILKTKKQANISIIMVSNLGPHTMEERQGNQVFLISFSTMWESRSSHLYNGGRGKNFSRKPFFTIKLHGFHIYFLHSRIQYEIIRSEIFNWEFYALHKLRDISNPLKFPNSFFL